jgi:CO/xanthine dehydrogenase FAD-binding subunit
MLDRFEYLRPQGLEEALRALEERGSRAKILAGGTDLLVRMKDGAVKPDVVLDIGGLTELRGIHRRDKWVWIGPLTTHREVAASDLIRSHGPALAQGAGSVGSPQIRQRGTIGGNLVNASPAADTVPPLMALLAEAEVSSMRGRRWLPVDSFFEGPGQTVLGPHELLTGLRFPVAADGRIVSRYEKFGTRNALSVAVTSVAAAARMEPDGKLTWVRIALGSVSPMVVRAPDAEQLLTGQVLREELIVRAAQAAARQCCPIDDVRGSAWYRRQLVTALSARILRAWIQRSRS